MIATPAGSADALRARGDGGRGASVDISHLSVSYAGNASAPRDNGSVARGVLAVDDVSFAVKPGEVVVIVGPSGCGKSTLLKAIAGLIVPSRGSALVAQEGVTAPRVGFVFQSDALLPWRTAVENVELAVRLAGAGAAASRAGAMGLMEELGLGDSCDKYPAQLSGGMRKRVSLARALAYEPAAFLMDEPFAALDAHTRIYVGNFFLRLLQRFGQSVVFVTHDIDEAVAIGDRILVMSRQPGRIAGSFDVPLARPRDYYTSRFTDGFRDLQKRVWDLLGESKAE